MTFRANPEGFFLLSRAIKAAAFRAVEPAPCSRACADVFPNSFSKTSNHQSYHLLREQSELRTSIRFSIVIVFLCFTSAVNFEVGPMDNTLNFWPCS